jgi:isorenieratene synthase
VPYDLPAETGPFTTIVNATNEVLDLLVSRVFGPPIRRWIAGWIRRRLRDYKVRINVVDTLRPARLPASQERQVAVIGGGLAGMSAAITLAERGYTVDLFEASSHLGGKLGAWTETFADGSAAGMEHGFHAFFPSYYNLLRYFDRRGMRRNLRRVESYKILMADGSEMAFDDAEPVPLLNLVSLLWRGVFDWREFFLSPQHVLLKELVSYEKKETYQRWDRTSFETFKRRYAVPERLAVMFTIFARTFFARADQISMAAMLRSFHLYYTGMENGLLYEYATDDHARTVLGPMRAHLDELGVKIHLGHPARSISRRADRRLDVDGAAFDAVVLATDVRTAHALLHPSPIQREAPGLVADLHALRPTNRYVNWRLWLDRDTRPDLPPFTGTERKRVLDAVCFFHRCEAESRAWVAEHGGSVIELHSYQLPDDLVEPDAIRAALLEDLHSFLPELRGAKIVRDAIVLKDDFTPFHTGLESHRPSTRVGIDNLVVAGDWVDIGIPAKLMEGAFTSGILAANALCDDDGVRTEPVWSVPLRGMLKGNG